MQYGPQSLSRQQLTKPVVQTNISTFLTLCRGISNGRRIGEKRSYIIERLSNSILTLFDNDVSYSASSDIDIEFQSWFGLQSHVSVTPTAPADVSTRTDAEDLAPEFPDIRVYLPRSDLFAEGIGINTTDMLEFFS
jgi:hypothetical protein